MDWDVVMRRFSTLLQAFWIERTTDQANGLEILLLKRQLAILTRQNTALRLHSRTDKLTLFVLITRSQAISGQQLHKRVRDTRDDLLHKLTTVIAKRYGFVAVEDLHVLGLLQSHKLALSLSDAVLGKLLTLLEHKVAAEHGTFVKVDRFFASSKTCANCGHQREALRLSERTFVCPGCSFSLDRDWNAALNILTEGLRVASSTGRPVVATTDINNPLPGYNLDKGLRLKTFDHNRTPEK